MKRGIKVALSTALVASVAMVGPAFCLTQPVATESPAAAAGDHVVRRSVIKVHTNHGVITLPGTADSWTEVERAIFVADSIADVQMVNNEVPWRIFNE
jgi:hypothetical protein